MFLAGGHQPVTRKYKDSETLVSKIRIYISTNYLPDFGPDQATIEDRLHIFHTKEIIFIGMRQQRADRYTYIKHLLDKAESIIDK